MWTVSLLRVLLILECLILSVRYLKEHTRNQVYVREVTYEMEAEQVYGIGFDPEKGELFWFQKKTEMKQE